ncbi:MAG: cupin domain-containing protein [Alphaproteobacteria bacterium]
MKRYFVLGVTLAAGVALGFVSSQIIQAQPSGYSKEQIYRGDLANLSGQEVIIYASDWPPGFRLPWHVHPEGHELVCVVEGEQTFEVDGIAIKVVKAGEVIHTPPNVAHYGRNATDKVSKTVVIRIKEKSQPILVDLKK